MIVSLYTSRVILSALGFVDFGLYSVVAGVIALFSFINNAMGTASSRFMSFELGVNDSESIKKIFSTSFNIHTGLAIVIVIICESIGLYILNYVLIIPEDRLFACNVIYQFVVVSTVLSFTQVSMNALIMSYERMNVYAYIGIMEALLKLFVAYMISISTFDKLITLGGLNLIVSIVMYLFYHIYCNRTFDAYNISFTIDKKVFKKMAVFSIWNLLGSSANMLKNQGINMLINIFFGPIVNTANAIAYQVNSVIVNFSSNLTTAMNPQIIKLYAADEMVQMKNLIFRGSKFSFYLLMITTIPILLETNTIMKLWLNDVPQYTVELTKLVLLVALIESFVIPISVGVQATGKIKYYQICITSIYLLSFPITYIFFKFGAYPTVALQILIVLAVLNIFVRLFFLKKYVNISIVEFFCKVLLVSFVVFIASIILPLLFCHFLKEGLFRLFVIVFSSLFSSILFIYLLGLTKQEKQKLNIKRVLSK